MADQAPDRTIPDLGPTDSHSHHAGVSAPLAVAPLPRLDVAPFPKDRFLAWIKRLKVQTKDFGLRPFELLGTQQYVFDEIINGLAEGVSTFVILKARQLGMSTFFIALDLFWAFEYPGLSGAFATHTDQSKNQFRNIIKVFFANLPRSHKVKPDKENRDMLILQNSSMFQYLVAGIKQKDQSNMGRSGAFNFLHATEVAFWGSEDDKKELGATLSTHYPHRLEIYESTANGFNHFERQWESAKSSPTVKAIFVGWWRNELYAFPQNHPWFDVYMPEGADTALSPLERRRSRAVRDLYGAKITPEQIAWYRWKLAEQTDGDQAKMDEMFPWTEDDAFVATGAKFFTNESLTDAMRGARKMPLLPFRYLLKETFTDTAIVACNQKLAELKVWEEANDKGIYAIGCDPAYGSSDEADRTVIHVGRCFADKLIQVAEFCSPRVSTYQCAWILAHLCGYYKNCVVNLEITGPGSVVFDELNRLKIDIQHAEVGKDSKVDIRNVLSSMKHYLFRRPDNPAGTLAFQWRTTAETKTVVMNSFKDAFELRRHIINSMYCLDEMKGIILEDGQIHGEGAKKDDRVMAAALANEAYKRWVQQRLFQSGMSYERAMRDEVTGGASQIETMAIDYLRGSKILMPGQNL
jgi:hypothetical protein